MWKDLDLEQMAEEENRTSLPRPPAEVEQIVVMARRELDNRSLPCGVRALHRRLNEFYHLKPLPSMRTIGRILSRNGLTERR
jgi:putative transposase